MSQLYRLLYSTESNSKTIMNSEQVRISMAVVAYLKVIFQTSPEESLENDEKYSIADKLTEN